MPYVNALVKNGSYDPNIPIMVWREGAHKYAMRENVLSVSNLKDRTEAERIGKEAVERVNDIRERRDRITPDHSTRVPPKLLDILRYLPRTNCRDCGVASCTAFAAQLIEGERCPEDCPAMLRPDMKERLKALQEMGL